MTGRVPASLSEVRSLPELVEFRRRNNGDRIFLEILGEEISFEAFARGSACNLHVVLHAGENLHHMTEICFKAFAKALRAASTLDPRAQGVRS